MKRLFRYVVLLVMAFQHPCVASNWAHWRGPIGNGVALDAQPPVQWSSTENIKWKVAIPGRGSGAPIIWQDRVFVVTAVPVSGDQTNQAQRPAVQERRPSRGNQADSRRRGPSSARLPKLAFKLLCFDRSTGQLTWEQTATEGTPHQGMHATNSFASASPCTDGKHIYAHFGSRGLYCYSLDGELKWKRTDFGQMDTRNGFGEGSSPTLAENKILVPWDHEGASFLYALNKSTGDTVWRAKRDEPSCWATPLVVEHNGGKQVVMNGQTCARSYDLETGRELWRCAGQTQRPVASAVAMEGLVIVGSGFRGSYMGAFRLDGQGDIENTRHVAWTLDRDTPDIPSPLLSGGRVYFYRGRTGALSCVDAATGNTHYDTERIAGLSNIYASPIAAGGYVYLTGRNGTTVVIKDSAQLEILASNSVGETVDATPAPVDKELFIRGENHLFCIAE